MDEPTTPAALPRNREADEWRARYEAAKRDLCRTAVALFPVGFACLALVVALIRVVGERDTARAALAAAEQRAQVAEERLRVAEDRASARGAWHCGNVSVVCFDETSCVCAITSTPRRKP